MARLSLPQAKVKYRNVDLLVIAMSEYDQDKKIQKIDEDILRFKEDLRTTEAQLNGLESRLDEQINKYRAMAKMKRDSYEDMNRRLQTARKEWEIADKDYKFAEKQKSKQISDIKKRANIMRNRIKDAAKAREKRIREIDKEKQKAVEKAKRDKAKEMEKLKQQEIDRTEEEKRRALGL